MIKWNDSFSINNEEIDEQHKKLIGIIEKVAGVVSKKNYDFSSLLDVVQELDDYVEDHFNYEEELMKKYNYPDLKEQVAQHDYFRNKMSDLNVFDVDSEKYLNDMLNYLTQWLVNHIVGVDKKLGLFLSDKQ